mgnify:CR=1 FL=1
MKYRWEQFLEGQWRSVEVASLPLWLKKKKAVLWASRGRELSRSTMTRPAERYRLVKQHGSEDTKLDDNE